MNKMNRLDEDIKSGIENNIINVYSENQKLK